MANLSTEQDVTLGFYDEFGIVTIYSKQGDTQRYIKFEFADDTVYEDLNNYNIFIRGKFSDNTLIPIIKVLTQDNIEKVTTLPTASEELVGVVYKYIGETDVYVNGKCYKCTETIVPPVEPSEQNPDPQPRKIYSWVITVVDNEIGTNYIKWHIPEYFLSVPGKTVCDLILCKGVNIIVNPDGTIQNEDEIQILSTHKFVIHVEGLPTNGGIYSEHKPDYIDELTRVVLITESFAKQSESYARGGTNTRTGEDTDNAKYYYEQTKDMIQDKGIMDVHIDNNGHLIYQRTDDLSNISFSINDHKTLILTVNE